MKVIVVPYNSEWPKLFQNEAIKIQKALGNIINEIHHIGSTSVPDLMAKPIIDIMLDVTSLDLLDDSSHRLENLGYESMGEMGIPGRRYFRKGGYYRSHQIHAFQSGDPNLDRHLAFRDYLTAHKNIANEYGQLKFNIAKECSDDIDKYWKTKDPFIKHHEALALDWYNGTQDI